MDNRNKGVMANMSIKRFSVVWLAIAALVLLGACGGSSEPATQAPPAESAAEKADQPKADQPQASAASEGTEKESPTEAPAESPEPEPAKKDAPSATPTPPPVKKDKPAPAKPAGPQPALLDPGLANETAPDLFRIQFNTTKGHFTVEIHRDWAPHGADRLYNLVKIGYFKDIAFFRVLKGFMAQFGIHGNPEISAAWRRANIPDDPVKQSNKRGRITFATAGPNTRSVQFFINYDDRNAMLDSRGFAPLGQVVAGMEVVDSLYNGYGEGAPRGPGPNQMLLQQKGNSYLKASYPNLDYIKSAALVK